MPPRSGFRWKEEEDEREKNQQHNPLFLWPSSEEQLAVGRGRDGRREEKIDTGSTVLPPSDLSTSYRRKKGLLKRV